MTTETLVEVTQADRELWKFILDAPFATCSRIDNLPSDCPELQEIARHRVASQASTDRPTSELVERLLTDAKWLARRSKCEVVAADVSEAATHITALEATIARLQAAMREAASAAQVYLDEGSDPFDPSCDRLEASIATLTTLLSDAPEDRGAT